MQGWGNGDGDKSALLAYAVFYNFFICFQKNHVV